VNSETAEAVIVWTMMKRRSSRYVKSLEEFRVKERKD